MEVIEDVRCTDKTFPSVVLTVGSFDGVHLGHQFILDLVTRKARELSGTAVILTMRPHPREYFAPEHAPNLLTSEEKKLELLEEAGVHVVYVLPFNAETAAMEPLRFVDEIVHERCHAVSLVVGHDCRFGRGAAGDFHFLVEVGPRFGFEVEQAPPLFVEGERVSSTLIRERVLQGDLGAVESLLGRKYSVTGVVESGRGIGRTLGFPTANVKPHHSAVPAQGVYVAEALLDGRRLPAAVNIGIAPTIRHEDITVEAHVLDFDEDIRNKPIEIVFHKRLRTEKKFANREELSVQIGKDIQAVRDYF